MKVDTYPRNYNPFNVFADAPYDCTIIITDRSEGEGSCVYIHTHVAGLKILKELIEKQLEKLLVVNKSTGDKP